VQSGGTVKILDANDAFGAIPNGPRALVKAELPSLIAGRPMREAADADRI